MADFLDNQEITQTALNNIAIDLGATAFNGFATNKFGVDELNNITKSLVGKGITQSGNKCNTYLSGSDLYINTGTIIFASGAKIRIESPVQVTKQANTYIYALNNTSRNIAEIVVSETEPTTGDFVNIAYVDSNNALTDRREFAKAKVALTGTREIYSEKRTDRVTSSEVSELFTLDNGQEYTMCMIEFGVGQAFSTLTDDDTVSVGDSKTDDYYLFYVKKEGTNYTVSARLVGRGATDVSYTIYFA